MFVYVGMVQVDAPEDPAMYIHRVGRTARYKVRFSLNHALLHFVISWSGRLADSGGRGRFLPCP